VGVVLAKQQKRPKQLKQQKHQHSHSHNNQVKEHQPKKEEEGQDSFVALLNEANKIIQESKQYLSRYHKKKLVKK
jgi:hypothetical protein